MSYPAINVPRSLLPREDTLDFVASVQFGWSPESQSYAPRSAGVIAVDTQVFETELRAIIGKIKQSQQFAHLLGTLPSFDDNLPFPEVVDPVSDPLVVIDPRESHDSGVIPIAAYWQSGWESALPYVFLRQEVLNKLARVAGMLREIDPDLGLVVMDGYRSLQQQQELFDLFYPNGYKQGDPVYVSEPQEQDRLAAPHPSGGAVDVFLSYKGKAINLGCEFDYMEEEAHVIFYENQQSDLPLEGLLRRLLVNAMLGEDLIAIDSEIWHYENGTRRWAGRVDGDPQYGNAYVTPETYEGIPAIAPLAGSQRSRMEITSLIGQCEDVITASSDLGQAFERIHMNDLVLSQ